MTTSFTFIMLEFNEYNVILLYQAGAMKEKLSTADDELVEQIDAEEDSLDILAQAEQKKEDMLKKLSLDEVKVEEEVEATDEKQSNVAVMVEKEKEVPYKFYIISIYHITEYLSNLMMLLIDYFCRCSRS